MEHYSLVKLVHVLSSTVLFGTGIGSAFYMLFVSLTRNVQATAIVVRHVVIADALFTATTAIVQPVTGLYLVKLLGLPLGTFWIAGSLWLYGLAIACWLPVVWMQIRMRDLAQQAARERLPLPQTYWRFLTGWVALGAVALGAFLAIFYLMVFKPSG